MPPAQSPSPDGHSSVGGSRLSPALALDYVRELSADVRGVVVLDAAGALVAGSDVLASPARALLAASTAAGLEVVTPAGVVCAARDADRSVVAVCGRFALGGVVLSDLRAVLAGLAGTDPARSHSDAPNRAGVGRSDALERAAAGLIAAAQRAFGA